MLKPRKENYNIKVNEKYNNKKEKKENSSKKGLIFLYALFLALVALLVVVYINHNLQIMQLNSEIDSLTDEIEQQREINQGLSLELTRKDSLSRIENLARQELNMVEPEQSSTLVLRNMDNSEEESDGGTVMAEEENTFFLAGIFQDFWDKLNVVRAGSSR